MPGRIFSWMCAAVLSTSSVMEWFQEPFLQGLCQVSEDVSASRNHASGFGVCREVPQLANSHNADSPSTIASWKLLGSPENTFHNFFLSIDNMEDYYSKIHSPAFVLWVVSVIVLWRNDGGAINSTHKLWEPPPALTVGCYFSKPPFVRNQYRHQQHFCCRIKLLHTLGWIQKDGP